MHAEMARGLCVASGLYFFLPLVTVASFPVPTQLGFSIAGDVATYAGLLRFHRFVQAAIPQFHEFLAGLVRSFFLEFDRSQICSINKPGNPCGVCLIKRLGPWHGP